jgi:hypothetical protein
MPKTTLGAITIVYRDETQQFTTVSRALHFLRQDRIKMGWFHKIKAAVDLIADGEVSQTRHLKGNKFLIMDELKQLASDLKESHV